MSTPEQDLLAYEREQDRLDALEREAERNEAQWEADNYPTCSYCGADITAEREPAHTIKGGAQIGLTGPHVDTTMCHPCWLIDQLEQQFAAFAEVCRVAVQNAWSLIENAPTRALRIRAHNLHSDLRGLLLDAESGE